MTEPAPKPAEQVMRSVLVVEDDYELADVLSEVLTYENCLVEVITNGMDALARLREGDFEAVICDLMIPVIDGESLYREVTQRCPYLAEKFLFVVSHASIGGGLADFAYRTGNAVLEKPFEVEDLRTALKELLDR